jgi:hypothetical protein
MTLWSSTLSRSFGFWFKTEIDSFNNSSGEKNLKHKLHKVAMPVKVDGVFFSCLKTFIVSDNSGSYTKTSGVVVVSF